jgi:hypothetical protein
LLPAPQQPFRPQAISQLAGDLIRAVQLQDGVGHDTSIGYLTIKFYH